MQGQEILLHMSGQMGSTFAFSLEMIPFNPLKVVILTGWVYVCLYFVQRSQHSGLVPRELRPLASALALISGPILLFALMMVDIFKRSHESNRSFKVVLFEQIDQIIKSFRENIKIGKQSSLSLCDSSGRSIQELFGNGDRKDDRKTLHITEELIEDAIDAEASDILIDPGGDSEYSVRFRVDGVLRKVQAIDKDICKGVINCIKAVSGMDIAEKRRPQDGSFLAKTKNISFSFRVASAGAMHGEKVSIRVLNARANSFDLTESGISQKQFMILKTFADKPAGMILVCGPTGSGKTTTLYGLLNQMDLYTRNVITVEDPIEAVLTAASQIEINTKADITFAKCLRSILRQDPDVICVGEIRDEETAEIGLRAAQTGHLVLATLHSDSNASALVRLIDLGVSRILMSSAINLLVSQRLLRQLCPNCKVRAKLGTKETSEYKSMQINYANMYDPVGCFYCGETGYKGRTAIYDLLVITPELRDNISKNDEFMEIIRKEGEKKGKSNLRKQGLKKVVSGETSMQELKRVLG